jgi:hypothetical protein
VAFAELLAREFGNFISEKLDIQLTEYSKNQNTLMKLQLLTEFKTLNSELRTETDNSD